MKDLYYRHWSFWQNYPFTALSVNIYSSKMISLTKSRASVLKHMSMSSINVRLKQLSVFASTRSPRLTKTYLLANHQTPNSIWSEYSTTISSTWSYKESTSSKTSLNKMRIKMCKTWSSYTRMILLCQWKLLHLISNRRLNLLTIISWITLMISRRLRIQIWSLKMSFWLWRISQAI